MSFKTPLSWVPSLQDAIERDPLTLSPGVRLVDAIAQISQVHHHHTCALTDQEHRTEPTLPIVSASCALIVEGQRILGILTERDVVRLTATQIDMQGTTVAEVMVSPVITLPEQSVQDVFAALFLFRRYRIRHLPIVNDDEELVGVISHESVRQILRPANLLRFRRVADVMTVEVIHAGLTTTGLELAQLMAHHRVSCVVITQRDEYANLNPVGIVTERDIVQFQALRVDVSQIRAETLMSSPLFLLSPEDSLWTAYQEMQKRRVGRLVVSWNWGQGLGIITQTSLLRVFDPMEMYGVIENLQQTIQQMEGQENALSSMASSSQHQSSSGPIRSSPVLPVISSEARLSSGCNPQIPTATLEQIYHSIVWMLTDIDRSAQERRVQLQKMLDILAPFCENATPSSH